MKRVDSKLSHLNIFLGDGCGRNFNSIRDIKWSWKLKLNKFPKNSNFTLEVILRKRFLQLDFCPFLGLSVEFKQSNSKSLSSKRLFWAVRPLWKVSTTFLDHKWGCHWDREGQLFSGRRPPNLFEPNVHLGRRGRFDCSVKNDKRCTYHLVGLSL